MINKVEYEIIKSLLLAPDIDEINIDEIKFNDEISALLKDKFIRHNIIGETSTRMLYNGYKVTPQGLRAYEEYLAFIESQSREIETVKTAKEANAISRKANALSEKANALSEKANIIASGSKTLSKWAIGVSIIAAIISVIDIIVGICT